MSSSPLSRSLSLSVERGLSPSKLSRDRERSTSRNSSRSSLRTHSPSFSVDDPVAVRNQMSTLKHTIRQQQAQLHSLENIIRSGPRSYSVQTDSASDYNNMSNGHVSVASTSSLPPSAFSSPVSTTTKMKRRSSYDVLQGLAGPDSNLPLPKRDVTPIEENGIPEGIPITFTGGTTSPTHHKRASSPTRTLSRIPVASVGNARVLADEGASQRLAASTSKLPSTDPESPQTPNSGLQPPLSPNRRLSFTPGGTTKVLADLQTGVVNARNALENTKAQLRLSQRSVAQLTRQTEDLKEVRERLRVENEGLNNVVARKERLLQEVLERARKAEAEAATLKTQLKSETTTSKKSLREMETALTESTALSQKSEREYITLRDSIKGMVESWKQDTDRLKMEMRKREEKWRAEAESVGKKYLQLLDQVKFVGGGKEEIIKLKEEDRRRQEDIEAYWKGEIEKMKAKVGESEKENEKAVKTAQTLSEELARLRRLMQTAGRRSSTVSITTPIPEDIDQIVPL